MTETESAFDQMSDADRVTAARLARDRITEALSKRIVGQKSVQELMLCALLARGHSLFIGLPGLAKTLLVQTLADVLGLRFNRIQFTPDLMPSDITGTDVLEEDRATGKRAFRFMQGPVFTHLLLADEINRTPPKTQAALLQAMQENRVTVAGHHYPLEAPFQVFATENPIEQEGTYPLPEAQLDRFMMMIPISYPTAEEELAVVQQTTGAELEPLSPVLSLKELLEYQALVRRIPVSDHVASYAVKLARKSRPTDEEAPDFIKNFVKFGAGPRASQSLILAGKARALLDGRLTVSREDIKALAPSVLTHRVLTNFHAEAEGLSAGNLVAQLIEATPINL